MGFLKMVGHIAGGAIVPFFPPAMVPFYPPVVGLGMTQLDAMIQREIRDMCNRGLPNAVRYIEARPLPPPSFEDWICTPNTETYQEYQDRRLPSTHSTSTTDDREPKVSGSVNS